MGEILDLIWKVTGILAGIWFIGGGVISISNYALGVITMFFGLLMFIFWAPFTLYLDDKGNEDFLYSLPQGILPKNWDKNLETKFLLKEASRNKEDLKLVIWLLRKKESVKNK